MKNTVAIINLHSSPELGLLTEKRPLASTTFLGRYTFIDFTLSNLTNSGIDNLGVLIKDSSRSIIKHIRGNNIYLKNTKTGYLNYMINEKGLKNPFFNTDLNNIKENDYFLYEPDCRYVLIVPVGFVMKIDYREVIKEHIKFGKPISLVYKEVKNAGKDYKGLNKFTVDAIGNVQKVTPVDDRDDSVCLGLKTYIIDKDYIKELLNKSKSISSVYSLEEIVGYVLKTTQNTVHAIKYDGYLKYFNSLKNYFEESLKMKSMIHEKDNELFSDEWKFYTRTHDTRPVLYGEKCYVRDSLISNGCTINGTVTNSVLARNVIVEEGATVEDSIIFTDCVIEKGVHLKSVVSDKLCVFSNKEEVFGSEEEPLYIPQGAKI